MKRIFLTVFIVVAVLGVAGCNTYKAKPLSFKAPSAYSNSQEAAGAIIAAKGYADKVEAKETFGFDVNNAGLLPVLVVFDNTGGNSLRINGNQTFLEDQNGNLWPVLADKIAYERVTKYAETNQMFKKGAKDGFLGAAAGALLGAAIGIVSGDSIAANAGKGAALGGAAGATLGGASKYGSNEASQDIIEDLESKTLENKAVPGNGLAFGYIFFPMEAESAKKLRLQIKQVNTGKAHTLTFDL